MRWRDDRDSRRTRRRCGPREGGRKHTCWSFGKKGLNRTSTKRLCNYEDFVFLPGQRCHRFVSDCRKVLPPLSPRRPDRPPYLRLRGRSDERWTSSLVVWYSGSTPFKAPRRTRDTREVTPSASRDARGRSVPDSPDTFGAVPRHTCLLGSCSTGS